jgi:nucleoid-associated protein YgaU
MINALSRYQSSVDQRDGVARNIAVPKPRISTDYSTYTARDGDTFSALAYRFLGDPTFFWRIADINPQVPFPDRIPAGTQIRIPTR